MQQLNRVYRARKHIHTRSSKFNSYAASMSPTLASNFDTNSINRNHQTESGCACVRAAAAFAAFATFVDMRQICGEMPRYEMLSYQCASQYLIACHYQPASGYRAMHSLCTCIERAHKLISFGWTRCIYCNAIIMETECNFFFCLHMHYAAVWVYAAGKHTNFVETAFLPNIISILHCIEFEFSLPKYRHDSQNWMRKMNRCIRTSYLHRIKVRTMCLVCLASHWIYSRVNH